MGQVSTSASSHCQWLEQVALEELTEACEARGPPNSIQFKFKCVSVQGQPSGGLSMSLHTPDPLHKKLELVTGVPISHRMLPRAAKGCDFSSACSFYGNDMVMMLSLLT